MQIKNSQNFLKSNSLVQKLVNLCDIDDINFVIEIGPGKGIITRELVRHFEHVVAIELDQNLYLNLKNTLSYSNLEIRNCDFLQYPLPDKNYCVISNIPFNITADILTKLLDSKNSPEKMFLIMQTEALMKYAGMPYYHECLKSLLYKPFYEITKIYDFNPSDFYPVPKANICFARFAKKQYSDLKFGTYEQYRDFLCYIFMCKGQTFKQKTKNIFSYEQLKRIRKQVKIDYDDPVSTWSYESFLKLYREFLNLVPPQKQKLIDGFYEKYIISQEQIEKIHRNRLR